MENIIEPEYMEFRAGCVSRLKPRSCQDCHIRGGFEYHCEIFPHRISSAKGYEDLMEKLHCSDFCQDVGQKADAIAYQLGWVADAPEVSLGHLHIRCSKDYDKYRPRVTISISLAKRQHFQDYTPEELGVAVDQVLPKGDE